MSFTYRKLKFGRPAKLKPENTEILVFLWKWKYATSSLIKQMLFPNLSRHTMWKKLNKLERAGFIDCQHDIEQNYFAWTLTKKGLLTLYEVRPHLKDDAVQEGSGSEYPRHDVLATAFHIGDFAFVKPASIELVSEQEMRRIQHSKLPDWVPPTGIHRPDGYTVIRHKGLQTIIAVEMEMSQKNEEAYARVFRFYYERADIHTVLWVVQSKKHMEKMQSIMASHRILYPEKHNFILFDDFLVSQWNAKILSGTQTGMTIREYIWRLAVDIPGDLLATLQSKNSYVTLLKPVKIISA